MKLKILLLTTALVVSNLAFADAPAPSSKNSKNQFEDYYAKIELGGTKANKITIVTNNVSGSDKSESGFIGGLGGGYTFNEFFKTDLMLQYKKNKAKEVKVDTYDAMLNGYLTAHNETVLTPYVMAGIGVGHNITKFKGTIASVKLKKTNFIWNLGFGCEAKVADQASIGLGYRYVDFGKLGGPKIASDGSSKVKIKKLKAHEIIIGLVYHL